MNLNREIKTDLIQFGIIIAMLLGLIGAFHAFGESTVTLPYQPPYGCHWERCDVKGNKLVNCSERQYGSSNQLVDVITETNSGAVRYECGHGMGEKK